MSGHPTQRINRPKEGEFGRNPPASTSEVTLIMNGRILDNAETLGLIRKAMMFDDDDTLMTVLLTGTSSTEREEALNDNLS